MSKVSKIGPVIPAEPFLARKKKEIYEWCKEGVTNQELADRLGITVRNLDSLLSRSDELREWVEKSRERVDFRVEGSLYKQSIGYHEETTEVITHPDGTQSTKVTHKFYAPNIAATQFWLKNRQPDRWSEKGGTVEQEEKPPLIINMTTSPSDGDQPLEDPKPSIN